MEHLLLSFVFIYGRERVAAVALEEYSILGILASFANDEQDLVEATAQAPYIGSLVILLLQETNLRSSIPPGTNVT